MSAEAIISSDHEVNLSQREIADQVVKRSFLSDFSQIIQPVYDPKGLMSQMLSTEGGKKRTEQQYKLVTYYFPLAWYYNANLLEIIGSNKFLNKLYGSHKPDHDYNHLARVGNNFIVGSAYDLEVTSLATTPLKDFSMAGMAACYFHDHLQIDSDVRENHDYAGSLLVGGAMKLGQIYDYPFTDSQIRIAMNASYYHSDPSQVADGFRQIPAAREILEHWGKPFTRKNTLLSWVNSELHHVGADLGDLETELQTNSERQVARLVALRVGAADKRDAVAPPFLSLIRTMMTGRQKPWIKTESLSKSFKDFEQLMRAKSRVSVGDDVSRVIYEIGIRDYFETGFSAFERSWLEAALIRKAEYAVEINRALVNDDTHLIKQKYWEYFQGILIEGKKEGFVSVEASDMIEKMFFNLKEFSLRQPDLSEGVIRALTMMNREYRKVLFMFKNKSFKLRQLLAEAGFGPVQYLSWFEALINQAASSRLRSIVQHNAVPKLQPYVINVGVKVD